MQYFNHSFGSIRAENEAREAADAAEEASRQANRNSLEYQKLSGQLDRLALLSQAMYELIAEKNVITDKEFEDKILEVDQRDGKKDGKLGYLTKDCPHCHRKVTTARKRCLYCGESIKGGQKFEL